MSATWRRRSAIWRRAPFAAFVVLGGIVFCALGSFVPWGRETIRVEARTVAALVERRANALGRDLTDDERVAVVEDFVREEILVREAYRRRWHQKSPGVRRRLLLAMAPASSGERPPAAQAQLSAYFRAHAERYRVPESLTFSHVFFEHASALLPEDASEFLETLEANADFRGLGDEFWLAPEAVRQTRQQLRGALGASFADAVFALEPGSWAGPFTSTRGTHFVRVDERHPSELPALEGVRRFVEVDWESERRAALRDETLSRLRGRYSVIER